MAPKDDAETAALKKELNDLIAKFQVLWSHFGKKREIKAVAVAHLLRA